MTLNQFIKENLWSGEKSKKIWLFSVYIVLWIFVMIYAAHSYEKKVIRAKMLGEEVKELSSEFLDISSELMKKKMESNLIKKLEPAQIYPSETPPTKIRVIVEKDKKWYELWKN